MKIQRAREGQDGNHMIASLVRSAQKASPRSHSGSTQGTAHSRVPSADLSVAVLCNVRREGSIRAERRDMYLERDQGTPPPVRPPGASPAFSLDARDLRLAHYRSDEAE